MMIHDNRQCQLGEGAFWHPERRQFFWFDILGKRLDLPMVMHIREAFPQVIEPCSASANPTGAIRDSVRCTASGLGSYGSIDCCRYIANTIRPTVRAARKTSTSENFLRNSRS